MVYSINVPSSKVEDIKGVAIRPMGGTQITVKGYSSLESDNGIRSVKTNLKFETRGPKGTDTGAFFEGYVTVTPLRFDWTAKDALKELEGWGLTTK